MTVETAIYNILRADAGVIALCPGSRIKVPGAWQNLARPYIVHQPVTIQPTRTHTGLESLNIWDYYQVSVFADTYSAGRVLVDAVIAALDGWHNGIHCALQGGSFYVGGAPDFELEQFVVNFQVAESLSTSPA